MCVRVFSVLSWQIHWLRLELPCHNETICTEKILREKKCETFGFNRSTCESWGGFTNGKSHFFLLPALFSEMSTNHSHSWYHSIRGINYKILHMATFLAYLLWWFGWMCNRIFFCCTLRLNANLTEFQTQNANLIWWICVQVTQCTTLPVRRTPNQIW